jgi:hypothetical protein
VSALAADLARALDPVALAGEIGMVPDAWQAAVLRSSASRVLLNCSRQSGKTTTAALLALHVALYEPGALVLVLSASERQARELFRVALVAYRVLSRPVPSEAENRLSLELENGSRIIVVPATAPTIRGYAAVRLLIVDEGAQVPDELYATVRPMLAVSGGRIVAMSTPFGRRGWWFEAWRGDERWERYEVPASDCPRISAAFLAEERETVGEWFYRQEYQCEFLDGQGAAFREEDIERMFAEEVAPWTL